VHPDYRRHGIATALFDHVLHNYEPDLHHSGHLSADGRVWAEHEQSRNKEAKYMTAAVTVYTKPNCPQCTMTKKQLDRLGIEHRVIDVTVDPDAHAYVTGLGYQQAPVVVVGDGERHWGGFSPDKLKGLVE
jgi:glutaredoxin-like protein NrdH